MQNQINFYAPYRMPDGSLIYGAAAANRRAADAGGFNKLAQELVMVGITLGYNQAVRNNSQQSRR